MPSELYSLVLFGSLILAPPICLVLFFIQAPYGRFRRSGWGPQVDARFAWLAMELPAVLVFTAFTFSGNGTTAVTLVLFTMWQIHYVHRALFYPFTLRKGRTMPVLIVLMAILFNLVNGYLNGMNLAVNTDKYASPDWFLHPLFALGVMLFAVGMGINKSADRELRSLRSRSGEGYEIPRKGLHAYVSCANYFGELLQWTGWAIATWSLAGLSFALWTFANLVPRAIATHRWYRESFASYPQRKAIIPGVL